MGFAFPGYYWCSALSKSFTVLTGLKVSTGTSTKIVFQSLMAPFQSPGNSKALRAFPFFDFSEMKQVFLST